MSLPLTAHWKAAGLELMQATGSQQVAPMMEPHPKTNLANLRYAK